MAAMAMQEFQIDAMFTKNNGRCDMWGRRARSNRGNVVTRESKSTGAIRPAAARPAVQRPRAGPVSRSRGATCRRNAPCEVPQLCSKLAEANLTIELLPATPAPKVLAPKEVEVAAEALVEELVSQDNLQATTFVSDLIEDVVADEGEVTHDIYVDSDAEDDDVLEAEVAAKSREMFDDESADFYEVEEVCNAGEMTEQDTEMEAFGLINLAMNFAKTAVRQGLEKEMMILAPVELAQAFPVEQKTQAHQDWRLRPSVGTWMMPLPLKMATAAPKQEVAFQLRPSVGTWMMPLPAKIQAVAPKQEVAFQLRPSVGTWMMPLPAKIQAVASEERISASARAVFELTPSVGTWFTPILGRPQAAPKPALKLPMAAVELPCFSPSSASTCSFEMSPMASTPSSVKRSKRRIIGGVQRESRTEMAIETELFASPKASVRAASPAGTLRPKLKEALIAFRMDDDDEEETPALQRKSSLPNAYDALDAKFFSMEEKCEPQEKFETPSKRELPQLGELRPSSRHMKTSPVSRTNSMSAMFADIGGGEALKAPVLGPLTPSRSGSRSGVRVTKQMSTGLLPMLTPTSPSGSASRLSLGPNTRSRGSLNMGL